MRNKNVYITITPTSIELSASASKPGAVFSESLSPEVWEQAWSEGLRPLDEALGSLLTQASAYGARARVVYESPTAAVEVQSNSAVGKAAILAAKMAFCDGSGFNPELDPEAFVVLARDETGEPRRTHVLCAVDSAVNTQIVVDFIERSGLRVESLTPSVALTLPAAIETALEARTTEPTAALWIGEHHSAFAVASEGCVYYVRPIDLGLERIMRAMTRPILLADAPGDSEITLTLDEARDIFSRLGVPAYNQVVDEARQLRGANLLPLIQPVLQRLIIEIKQSIRFGVPESKREGIRLLLSGPGALIPGLAGVIANEAKLDLSDSQHEGSDTDRKKSFESAAAAPLARKINLLPPVAVTKRVSHRLHTGLIAGIVAGLLFLAADAGWTVWATRSIDTRIHVLDPIAQRIQERQQEYDEATNRLMVARQTIVTIADQTPDNANWSAWLAELTRLTPPEIRLTRLSGSYDHGEPKAEVAGVVHVGSTKQTRDLITHFLDSLRSCPLVDSVELGAVARNGVQAEATHGFHIVVNLIAVPTAPVIGEDES